jgi:hypothetical protein
MQSADRLPRAPMSPQQLRPIRPRCRILRPPAEFRRAQAVQVRLVTGHLIACFAITAFAFHVAWLKTGPALASGNNISSTTLTGWDTAVAAKDVIGINLKVVATATYVNLTVGCS